LLKNPLKDKHLHASGNVATIRTWLFFIISIQTVTALGISIFYLDFHIYNDNLAFLPDAHNQVFLASSGYAIFNIALLCSPKILYGTIYETLPDISLHTPITKLYIPHLTPIAIAAMEKEAVAHLADVPGYLSEAYIQKIGASIQQIIEKKEFSDPEFGLQQFSTSYNFPIHHISNYFNKINNVKFTEWRNSLRIQYAVQLINDGALAQTTLETIAARVGFASQNTFIRAFKNEVGKTPREYYKSIRENL
jgi:AraC-like DNA-binding protein